MSLVLTKELAQTIEKTETDALHSRLTSMQAIEGNPMGVEIQRFGNATAFVVKNIPGPSFNTVKGLTDGDRQFVDQLIEFYSLREIPVRFELTPAHASPDLLAHLVQVGFCQTDFHTSLYGSLTQKAIIIDERITIRRLENHEFDLFAEIYAQGFQMPSFLRSGIAQNNAILHGNDQWTFYLASVDDEPAGISVLFVKEGIASLAAAATVPHFRNKGVQQALIQQRIQRAITLHCRLVVGQAKFGSVSQNNMERAGLKIAYTKAIWGRRY